MPSLLRRRSVLDLLNIKADNEDLPRPESNGSLALRSEPPTSPRPVSEYAPAIPRLSRDLQPNEFLENARREAGIRGNAPKRFSLMKLRNFSESHLAVRARDDAAEAEPVPPLPATMSNAAVPAIVRTAPTMDAGEQQEEVERQVRPSFFKRSLSKGRLLEQRDSRKSSEQDRRKSGEQKREEGSKGSSLRWRRLQGRSTGLEDLARLSAMHTANNNHDLHAPPAYGDASKSALALPVPEPRFSESSRSDDSGGSAGEPIYGSTTTTTHTVSTHTTFFRLPRRNKKRNSLFPLPVRIPPPNELTPVDNEPATPRASISAYSTKSAQTPNASSPPATVLQRRHTEVSPTKRLRMQQQQPPLPSSLVTPGRPSLSFADPSTDLVRHETRQSRKSTSSSPLQPPTRLGMRERSSTTSSFGQGSHDMDTPPGFNGSARNSTSTNGRSSLGGFLSLARFRNGSDPHSPKHGSPGTRSKSNSFAMSREALVIPEREEGDTPGKYLERLEAALARSMIAGILSKSSDPFAQSVLRSYTRRFPFFGEPIDMSLRKFLLEAELPKETQQVDRVIQAFADRYHECNPGIFMAAEQAYIIAFSLMMLHTDVFNKNNKRKMQKQDYIKNTSGQQVADDVLACFYDNISYTPFVHYEEEVDINGERVLPFKAKKSKLKGAIQEGGKKPSGPVDPYNLLVDQKLDLLRPPIRDAIALDDPYDYRGSQGGLDPNYLQRAFTHTGVLQIISARSRPAAYEAQVTSNNPTPTETQAGIVDLKITKVGTLWRKAAKKKKARSPWQEWGAVLTGSQLYLFKNAHWAKGLLAQFAAQQRHGHPRTPVIFKPPLHDFKPDALIKTDNAVALVDSTYTRHKNAFTFFRAGAHEEVMLADNESELNDWLALINYAAAFRAAGVRIRGMVGGNEEDLRRRDVHRLQSAQSTQSVQTASGEVTVSRGGLSPQLQRQVMAARRQIMVQKIAETEKEIVEANAQLDAILRTGRHLLILAPIAPKTREDVMQAAARSDAMIKWVRRNIWRMKCHRDILAMDAQQDGVTAAEMHTLNAIEPQPADTSKKTKGISLLRLASKATAPTPARSPPQSPTSPNSRRSARRNTAESVETYLGNDVFRTPPESATDQRQSTGWSLPPLQLDQQLQGDEHRPSMSETLLTVSSPGRGSLSHASSASSMNRIERMGSPNPSEAASSVRGRITPTPSAEAREVELLARATIAPDSTVVSPALHNLGSDGAQSTSTPDSRHKGVRRSLQKTLRDAHYPNAGGSTHKHHRRGKESDSTIRSGGGHEGGEEGSQEGTPGLQREKGRFILHGKQASVIQFGNQWPNERMKLRREQWRSDSGESSTTAASPKTRGSPASPTVPHISRAEWSDSMASHVVRQLAHEGGESDSEAEASDAVSPSWSQQHSYSLRADAEAAYAYTASPDPSQFSFDTASASAQRGSGEKEKPSYFDLSSWDPDAGKRTTVIGPKAPGSRDGKDDAGRHEESDEEDFSLGPRENRVTVIGPSTSQQQSHGKAGVSAGVAKDAKAGAQMEGHAAAGAHGDEIVDENSRRASSVRQAA